LEEEQLLRKVGHYSRDQKKVSNPGIKKRKGNTDVIIVKGRRIRSRLGMVNFGI